MSPTRISQRLTPAAGTKDACNEHEEMPLIRFTELKIKPIRTLFMYRINQLLQQEISVILMGQLKKKQREKKRKLVTATFY
jgi:hypothetical protein